MAKREAELISNGQTSLNTAEKKLSADAERTFQTRLKKHIDEMRWLYMELYDNADMFGELEQQCREFYLERNAELKELDCSREQAPDWYKQNDMLGMMLYIDNFAGDLKGVQ
ncbi:MAG: amylosucrase, partial [Lachnospiraceae bacterium]|nr:amylosucrase [Lachnospiraceae bacterium]